MINSKNPTSPKFFFGIPVLQLATLAILSTTFLASQSLTAASKGEKEVHFVPAVPDPLLGDWQGNGAITCAQVIVLQNGDYQALLLHSFDTESNVIAVLKGTKADANITLSGDGWTGTVNKSKFTGQKGDAKFELHSIHRTSPTES